ncbi:MAG: DNA-binding protein [Lentisphaerae bacterium]|nr:DNA-binding protein [Lentisphaerota bacterium]
MNPALATQGDRAILDRPMVALFCSTKCPGKLILDAYDLAKHFREIGVTVISGFHSPMEEECLRILLRSPHPVIWCLGRGMIKRIPSKPVDCRAAVAEGRLLIVSPFKDNVRHVTAKTAMARNRIVADLATAVVVAHAAPGSKIEALSLELLAAGKRLYTFDHPVNAAILDHGAKDVSRFDFARFASGTKKGRRVPSESTRGSAR